MKKCFPLLSLWILLLALPQSVQAQNNQKTKTTRTPDSIDHRMKGPRGEAVIIGKNGGRYYWNSAGKKVYVPFKRKKKSK